MGTPFKMKGSPMRRNFGLSPMKDDKVVNAGILPTVEVSGGEGGKSRAQRDYDAARLKMSKKYASNTGKNYNDLTDDQKNDIFKIVDRDLEKRGK
jgi:hypothetical protein